MLAENSYEKGRTEMWDRHPLVVFGGRSSRDLSTKICEYLDIPLGKVDDATFPNGESMVRLRTDVRNKDVFVCLSTCRMRYDRDDLGYTGVNDNIIELCIWIDTLRRASAYRITAVIPYFGYARQDRKSAGRTPITARLVANLLETAGADRILTMDLHADQVQGFFNIPLDHLNAGPIISQHFNDLMGNGSIDPNNAVVLSPDVGNLKKADKYRSGLPSVIDIAFIDKRRDRNGDVRMDTIIGDVEGKTVIVLDDIISTAGTMHGALRLALKKGAKEFYIAATHGEFIGKAVQRFNMPEIKQICVTNTIPLLPEIEESLPIVTLGVSKLFGEAIKRIHNGESISELLGKFG